MEMKQEKWQEMLEAIFITEDDEIACHQLAEAQLAAYAATELAGDDPGARFPQIRQHLAQCPDCARQVTDTLEVLRLAQSGELAESWFPPDFDLSFLLGEEPETEPEKPFWWDELDRLIIDLAAALWQPPTRLAPAYVVKGEEEEGEPGIEGEPTFPLRFSLGRPEVGDLQVDITVVADRDDPELCTVVARAEVPSRWPELAGTEVTLTVGEGSHTSATDESGEVRFRRIPIGHLSGARVGVKPET